MELQVSTGQRFVLGLQHALAMFGATVLVPLLTGLHPSVALFTAGAGTLLFHLITGGKVPVFLGSSFAFIAGIQIVASNYSLAHATGGIMVAGAVYLLVAGAVALWGVERVMRWFPPIVSGPIIMVIGLGLSGVAIGQAQSHWPVALITTAAVVVTAIFARGFFKLIPIITGVVVGYAAAAAFGLVDFSVTSAAPWVALPPFMAPQFSWGAISIIAPIALVTVVEHFGDITANGAVIGKNLLEDPGVHRTLVGDGVATALAGLLGGPANTTYSENTGVLAVTRVYEPSILRLAAVIAIVLSLIGKFGAILQTIPEPVLGGISMVLFGMIAAIGLRQLVENRVDMTASRNLIIAALTLVTGIGGAAISITENVQFQGMGLAAIVGILLNRLLPENVAAAADDVDTGIQV